MWPVFLGMQGRGSEHIPDPLGSIDNFATRPGHIFFRNMKDRCYYGFQSWVYFNDGSDGHVRVRGTESVHEWNMVDIHISISLGRRWI